MRAIGERGVYRNPILPDFMVFLNWKELPWYWYGFDDPVFAIAMAAFAPGLLALVFGWFAFRSRISGVYFSIVTQAMTYALILAFFRNDMGFGGNNGLTDFKDLLGFGLQQPSTRAGLYFASLVLLMAALLLCRLVVTSKLGRVLIAIHDAEPRALPRLLGHRLQDLRLHAVDRARRAGGARSTGRRSASSIPASFRPPLPSRRSSGSRWAAAAPSSVRWSAHSRSTRRRRGSPPRWPSSGSTRSAPCSSL